MSFNPLNPSKYLGTNKTITFFVTRNRAPTLADFRQPETGTLYSIGTVWQVGKNPTTGMEGDLWMLAKIVANQGYWELISSGSSTVDSFQMDAFTAPGTNPVNADAQGLITVTGGQIANAALPHVIQTNSLALNAYTIQIQRTASAASTNLNLNGVSHFNSAQFSVDGNGFVSLAGGGAAVDSMQVDNTSGTGVNPVVPNSSGIILTTCAQVVPSGFGNALRTITNAPNQYTITVQQTDVSAASNTTKNGIAHFDSAYFNTDGTGFVTLKSAATGVISIQIFTASGTYTPTAGMDYCIMEAVGAGGGGGGTTNCGAAEVSAGGGGGSGSYARQVASAATIGASQTITIGAAGAAGATAAGNGGNGGDSSVGALCIGKGGSGGTGSGAAVSSSAQGGDGGVAGTGVFSSVGSQGGDGIASIAGGSGNFACGGSGGGSYFGGATNANSTVSGQQTGLTGQQYGGGGSGGSTSPSGNAVTGGAGFSGFITITEFS